MVDVPTQQNVVSEVSTVVSEVAQVAQTVSTNKQWYQSRTVWVALVGVVVSVAALLGKTISPDIANALPDIAVNVATLVSGIAAVYFRMQVK